MRARQSRFSRLSSLFCGALLLTACGGDDDGGASAGPDPAGAVDDTSEDDASEGGEATDAEAAPGNATPGTGPANGTMTLDGEVFELASTVRCPPRDISDPDNQYDSAELLVDIRAVTDDRFNTVRVMERLIDGVTSHRISDGSSSIVSEYVVEEGEPGFPIFEIEGDVITADGQLSPAGSDDPTLVTATWDVPEGFADEIRC